MEDLLRILSRILYYIFIYWIISLIFNPNRGRKANYSKYQEYEDGQSGFESQQEQEFSRMGISKLEESYQTLGVESTITDKDLKRVYLELAKKYHPDHNGVDASSIKMGQINAAYQYICEHRAGEKH